MEIEKMHNLSEVELAQQQHQAAEQLFRLRFQMRMGQNDGLEKLRALKKDVARMKTVVRQRQLGIVAGMAKAAPEGRKADVEGKAKKTAKAAAPATKKTVKASAGPKKSAPARKAKKEAL
ncbi:MAG: 50S ribosomal protein L29 [Acidobacteriaceae bacterium]